MTTRVGNLSSTYVSLINSILEVERQPMARLQTKVSELNVRLGVYSDVTSKLSSFQSQIRLLKSDSSSYALADSRKASVTDLSTTNATILTASVTSQALVGNYKVDNIVLGKEHRVISDAQKYVDSALNLTGSFYIGGGATNSVSNLNTTVDISTFGTGSADTDNDQKELSSDTYYVETRNDPTKGWQFRVVNSDGVAQSIRQGATSTYSSDWQNISVGDYDSGRGLTFHFDSVPTTETSRTSGAASVNYTSKGVKIDVSASDSLSMIASNINYATYLSGNEVSASVVEGQLLLSAKNTGVVHSIKASDVTEAGKDNVLQRLGILTSEGAFKHVTQTASNASFTVNGLAVTRSTNSGISNVINGVTFNLAADAQSKYATIAVDANWDTATSAINAFLTQFNSVAAYMKDKTGVTSSTNSDGETTYTRGALADDNIFGDLRSDMFAMFMSNDYGTTGKLYSSLRDIGLTINDSLQAVVNDSTKLQEALSNHSSDVRSLLDKVMSAFDTKVSRFTGSSGETGYLSNVQQNLNTEIDENNSKITDWNKRLLERQQTLVDQYSSIQALLLTMTYNQQSWQSIYSQTSSYTSSG